MRETLKDPLRLRHMIEAIDRVNKFMEGKTIKDFEGESLLFYGVVKNIEIIGEAAYKLTHEFKELHPETPWKSIVGMRHVLVHGYFQIALDEVFNIYTEDLPQLLTQLNSYLQQENPS